MADRGFAANGRRRIQRDLTQQGHRFDSTLSNLRVNRSRSAWVIHSWFSVGGDGAVFCPGSYGLDVFGAGNAEGLGVANFGEENVGGE